MKTKQLLVLPLVLAFAHVPLPLAWAQHPHPELRPGLSTQTLSPDGTTTVVVSPESRRPVLENEFEYVESNIFDMNGNEMLNTLPHRPGVPFNLHDGEVQISDVNKTSPADDLENALDGIQDAAKDGVVDHNLIQFGLDILEGNPIEGRAYTGIPMLHYTGPEKIKTVEPIFDAAGNKIGVCPNRSTLKGV